MELLVPGRGAGEDELDGDAEDVHVAKGAGKDRGGAGGGEEEYEAAADEG